MALDDRYLQSSESTVHRVCLSPKSDATSFTRLLVAPYGGRYVFGVTPYFFLIEVLVLDSSLLIVETDARVSIGWPQVWLPIS